MPSGGKGHANEFSSVILSRMLVIASSIGMDVYIETMSKLHGYVAVVSATFLISLINCSESDR